MEEFIHTLPLWTAKIGAVILFLIVLVATWFIPRSFIFQGAPDNRPWRDLRIWATILIIIQFIIYAIF